MNLVNIKSFLAQLAHQLSWVKKNINQKHE